MTNPSIGTAFAVDQSDQVLDSSGGASTYRFTASSGQANVKNSPGRICKLINASSSAQTATTTLYDNADGSTANQIFAKVLGASEVVDLQVRCSNGITVGTGGAITTAVLVTYV